MLSQGYLPQVAGGYHVLYDCYFYYLAHIVSIGSQLNKMSDIKNFGRMFSLDGKVALVTGGKWQ